MSVADYVGWNAVVYFGPGAQSFVAGTIVESDEHGYTVECVSERIPGCVFAVVEVNTYESLTMRDSGVVEIRL